MVNAPKLRAWKSSLHTSSYDICLPYSQVKCLKCSLHTGNSFEFQPFFLYLAHQAVHNGIQPQPLKAPQEYLDKFKFIKHEGRRRYAGEYYILMYENWLQPLLCGWKIDSSS